MEDLHYNKDGVKLIDQELIKRVVLESRISPRKRANICLHTEKEDMIQRMVIAIQPESYMRAHKHENPDKREIFSIYQGKVAVLTFKEDGNLKNVYKLALDKIKTIEIKPKIYHSIVALEPDSVILEIKDGPWESVEKDKSHATWMPAEDDKNASQYLQKLKDLIKTHLT